MIFVTVGTTLPFDELVRAVDEGVASGAIGDRVICQVGNGSYVPAHCEYFTFRQGIDDLVAEADVVVGHGGTGTVLGLMAAGARFVAVVNRTAADNHQHEFLEYLGERYGILWTAEPAEVPALIGRAAETRARPFDEPRLVDDLRAFIEEA